MTKDTLTTLISQQTSISKSDVSTVIESFMDIVKKSICKNETIYLRGFGRFDAIKRKPKPVCNFKEGKSYMSKAKVVPHFKPYPDFCNIVI